MDPAKTIRVQELEERLAKADYLDQKIDTLLELGRVIGPEDPQRAIELAKQAVELSQTGEHADPNHYLRGLADGNYLIGSNHMQLGNYDDALAHLFHAKSLYETMKDTPAQALARNAIGVTYLYSGAYADALSFFLQAYKIFLEAGRPFRLANILDNIGLIYLRLGDLQRALTYLEESLRIAREAEDERACANALDNLCRVHTHLGAFQEALRRGQESLEIYRKIGVRWGEAEVLDNIGSVYLAMGDYDQALSHFQEAFDIVKPIGYRQEMVEALRRMGDVYLCRQQNDLAREYMLRALEIAEQIGDRQKCYECHLRLVQVDRQSGNFEKALHHYENFHQIKETVFNEDVDKRLKNLEMQYQVEAARRDAEISHLKNVALQQEIEAREQLIDDLNAFAQTVAHDLKNPLQTQLLAVKLLAVPLGKNCNSDAVEYLQLIARTAEKMRDIVDELLLLASVRQQEIERQQLDMSAIVQEAVDRLADLISQSNAELIRPGEWPPCVGYAPWVEEVWVNYISNAIKYGGTPPRIELGARPEEGRQICFWVKDNGDGIREEQKAQLFTAFTRFEKDAQGYGLGLSIVKRIIDKLGGAVDVESSGVKGEGSLFTFTLPAALS